MRRYLKLKSIRISRGIKRSSFLNKYFPDFKNPVYWKGDRESFALGGFVGMFFMMMPVPFQMVLSSALAYYLKANIPLATLLAWITNPFTMVPIWYTGYIFGVWLLDVKSLESITQGHEAFSLAWFEVVFPVVWLPLYVGNITIGLLLGGCLFFLIKLWPSIKRFFKTRLSNFYLVWKARRK